VVSDEEVARAIAYFETCDDVELMRSLLSEIAPRARRVVDRHLRRGRERRIPPPARIEPARESASREAAVAAVRDVEDFAQLQALARAIGRRVEELSDGA
jgi:hypothetical protein